MPLQKNWQVSEEDFWSDENHMVLSEAFNYPEDKVFLNQNIVSRESSTFDVYRTFDHYYNEIITFIKILGP